MPLDEKQALIDNILAQMQDSNMGQQPVPQPSKVAQIATGLGSILRKDPNPIATQSALRKHVQEPVIAENAQRRQALSDKLKIAETRQSLSDEDPMSDSSKATQAAFLRSTKGIAKALQIPDEVMQTYVKGRSKKQLKEEEPSKVLLDIAKLNAAQTKAEKQPESSFSRKQNMNQADIFTKQVEQLPDLNERNKNLDAALAIANKVETGPLAGNDKVYFGQKMLSEDAQRLENFLSEENVRTIMKFAKEAGVRSIDTEAEQRRLLDSIANKRMSTSVLKETLNKMKRILNDTQTVIRAKQQYVDQHGDLKGFNPESALQGQIKNINGVQYKKAEDGKWYPVSSNSTGN